MEPCRNERVAGTKHVLNPHKPTRNAQRSCLAVTTSQQDTESPNRGVSGCAEVGNAEIAAIAEPHAVRHIATAIPAITAFQSNSSWTSCGRLCRPSWSKPEAENTASQIRWELTTLPLIPGSLI